MGLSCGAPSQLTPVGQGSVGHADIAWALGATGAAQRCVPRALELRTAVLDVPAAWLGFLPRGNPGIPSSGWRAVSSRCGLAGAGHVWGSAVLRRGDRPLMRGTMPGLAVLVWVCAAEDGAGTELEALLIPTGARNPAGSWWGWAEASLVFTWDPGAAWLRGMLKAPGDVTCPAWAYWMGEWV